MDDNSNCYFADLTNLSYKDYYNCTKNTTHPRNPKLFKLSNLKSEDILKITKMSFIEELSAFLISLYGLPGCVVSVPITTALIGYLTNSYRNCFILLGLLLIPLFIFKAKFSRTILTSWLSFQVLRYFSFKLIYEEIPEVGKKRIIIGPPHGVFPYCNIACMIAFPACFGYSIRGLAASSAMKTPIIKHILGSIGGIDAGRKSATKALNNNFTIGISSGGVSEVFTSNSNDQRIVLKSRKGITKLAIRTGAELTPSYCFGNTDLYSLFTGGKYFHSYVRKISRKIGFALILFWGRFGLPIPYRIPLLCVIGKPIMIVQTDEPTDEYIDQIHNQLIDKTLELFNKYKHIYGWEDKNLIIE